MSTHSVITSYSIHYTKLYDLRAKLKPEPALNINLINASAEEVKDLQLLPQSFAKAYELAINSVITSYSIHYTKLYENRRMLDMASKLFQQVFRFHHLQHEVPALPVIRCHEQIQPVQVLLRHRTDEELCLQVQQFFSYNFV